MPSVPGTEHEPVATEYEPLIQVGVMDKICEKISGFSLVMDALIVGYEASRM